MKQPSPAAYVTDSVDGTKPPLRKSVTCSRSISSIIQQTKAGFLELCCSIVCDRFSQEATSIGAIATEVYAEMIAKQP
ncbi:hypothetical protein CDAR_478861 [Caerostris darwini]|uniref:Uncharacterized protein n=1 Tax=Caerostris darwini TaxID=1538125 RepID=A0AAV4RRT1_9ARAC|nr:hypothetical protein CDAR_478861 [Caerostris darwini]